MNIPKLRRVAALSASLVWALLIASCVRVAPKRRQGWRPSRPRAQVQTAKRLWASLGLVASLLSLGCAPSFPAGSRAVLPIRDPLLRPDPSVLVTLPGGEGPWSVWMYPDSGVPMVGALLSPALVARLGPHYSDWCVTLVAFGFAPWEVGRMGLLSSLALGDLVVRDVPATVVRLNRATNASGILGQGILGHAPWEIDWDRGTLTLGATPWPEGHDVIVVPLRRRWSQDIVTLQVDGHPIELALDTGAPVSMIAADTARDAGLSEHVVDRRIHSAKAVSGDASLGPLGLGRIDFVSFHHSLPAHGVLGLDVLSRYRIQVVPGERLALRPRGDPWDSAPERIARWLWTRACPTPGCLRAHLEPVGDDVRLVFSFEVDVPQPVALLLGCRAADPAGSRLPTLFERRSSGQTRALAHPIFLRVASAVKDQAVETMVAGLSRAQCRDVSVLDVMPTTLDNLSVRAVSTDIMF
jgi:gag-polyprotein putative aspartyl protease